MRLVYPNPFEAEGEWFKGNLHTHTVNSDGHRTPEQIAEIYRRAGYDFISITDHGHLTDVSRLSLSDFFLIPGEEICAGSSRNGRFTHIVAIGISSPLPVSDFDKSVSPQRVIDLIGESGGFAFIGHPYWSDLTLEDLKGLRGHLGVEVYNTTCDLEIGRGYSSVHWDDLLCLGRRTMGFAVDDAHHLERPLNPSDSCKAWINVKAERLDQESIVNSIRAGLFYPSNGPAIERIRVIGSEIVAETSPVRSIAFISDRAHGKNNMLDEGSIQEASYELRGRETYVRVEVTDPQGFKAWSNPIYVEN